jgi:hypothetical protein
MIPCLSLNLNTSSYLTSERVSPQSVAEVIALVIDTARNQGQTLEDLVNEILAEDPILDQPQRRWLSNIIIQAWKNLPCATSENFSGENQLNLNHDGDTSSPDGLSTS